MSAISGSNGLHAVAKCRNSRISQEKSSHELDMLYFPVSNTSSIYCPCLQPHSHGRQ